MDSFFQILYVPFGFLFRILFDFVGNYGLALVIFTLFFRLILLPSAVKQQKGMAKQYRLQPKLKRIREKYQDYAPNERNQKIQMETNELYQQEGYSAMSAGCLPMLLQLPILWGLYGIIRMPLTHVLGIGEEAVTALTTAVQSLGETSARTAAYAESLVISRLTELLEANPDLVTKFPEAIQKIQAFDFRIFGIDLGTIPSTETFRNWAEASTEAKLVLLIPILSGITSLMTSVLSQVRQKKTNPDAQMQGMGCMMLSMPLMSLWFTFQFPAGMGMYWILSNVFAFFQTLILGHFYAPRKTVAQHMVAETIERRSYEKAKKSAADKEKNEQN
ncbi:MAG: YidC/Oxa1 family membrane protein insertase [Clostridia bacterium]|nr:YidC/Oxa1 family membrane protein insertase [Clostridia bacterium]